MVRQERGASLTDAVTRGLTSVVNGSITIAIILIAARMD
jgi:hypothetical protein